MALVVFFIPQDFLNSLSPMEKNMVSKYMEQYGLLWTPDTESIPQHVVGFQDKSVFFCTIVPLHSKPHHNLENYFDVAFII